MEEGGKQNESFLYSLRPRNRERNHLESQQGSRLAKLGINTRSLAFCFFLGNLLLEACWLPFQALVLTLVSSQASGITSRPWEPSVIALDMDCKIHAHDPFNSHVQFAFSNTTSS